MADMIKGVIDGILKTADRWYKNGYMLYAIIAILALVGFVLWRG